MTRVGRTWVIAGGLLAVSAGPPADADTLARRGLAALQGGDLASAELLLAGAAERTADPGWVAFNRATAAAKAGRFRDAELGYLQALDDAAIPPERRAWAVYNRGVCLVKRGTEPAEFRAAVECFDRAIDLLPPTDPLAADARHNLELAKLLWAQAKATAKTPPTPNDPPPEAVEPPRDVPEPDPNGTDSPGQPKPAEAVPGPPAADANPQETPEPAPGKGTLPAIPDSDTAPPLSADDARAILKRVGVRLDRDRRAARPPVPERPHVRDW